MRPGPGPRPRGMRADALSFTLVAKGATSRMNKAQIAARLAGRTGLSKSAAAGAVDAVFETLGEALARHEAVRIAGFGTFTTKRRPARSGRNPRSGEAVSIPASVAPAFKAGKALRGAVNGR